MTPGARAAAAIAVLEKVLAGQPAEVALTNWGRASRYAGSGDRAAVRDIVFDVLRQKRSCAARGGSDTARGLVLGWARGAGQVALFDGRWIVPIGWKHRFRLGWAAILRLSCKPCKGAPQFFCA